MDFIMEESHCLVTDGDLHGINVIITPFVNYKYSVTRKFNINIT